VIGWNEVVHGEPFRDLYPAEGEGPDGARRMDKGGAIRTRLRGPGPYERGRLAASYILGEYGSCRVIKAKPVDEWAVSMLTEANKAGVFPPKHKKETDR
jgi:hypothetical protein